MKRLLLPALLALGLHAALLCLKLPGRPAVSIPASRPVVAVTLVAAQPKEARYPDVPAASIASDPRTAAAGQAAAAAEPSPPKKQRLREPAISFRQPPPVRPLPAAQSLSSNPAASFRALSTQNASNVPPAEGPADENADRTAAAAPVFQTAVPASTAAFAAAQADRSSADSERFEQTAMSFPKPIQGRCPKPVYPSVARRRQYQGTVLLDVRVGRDGSVLHAQVRQTSGFAVLDNSARETVLDWRFEPGRNGAAAVDMSLVLPVTYCLTEP